MKIPLYAIITVCSILLGCTKQARFHVISADPSDRPSVVGTVGNLKYSLNVVHPPLYLACPGVLGNADVGQDFKIVTLDKQRGEVTLQIDGKNKTLEIDHIEEVSRR
jgi:hypothetical protein